MFFFLQEFFFTKLITWFFFLQRKSIKKKTFSSYIPDITSSLPKAVSLIEHHTTFSEILSLNE